MICYGMIKLDERVLRLWQYGSLVVWLYQKEELSKFTEEQLISWRSIKLSVNTSEIMGKILPTVKSW